MTEETDCKLTFQEGRRIRREAAEPYELKCYLCLGMAAVAVTLCILYADFKYDVLWVGQKALEDRILAGDFQAIVDWNHHNSLRGMASILGIAFVLCGTGYAICGHMAGEKALKKANEEKP